MPINYDITNKDAKVIDIGNRYSVFAFNLDKTKELQINIKINKYGTSIAKSINSIWQQRNSVRK